MHATPIPLRDALDATEIALNDPCDATIVLGSFWPYSRTSYESRLVKTFKACCPVAEFEPHISALARFYAELVAESVRGEKFDWVVRVLGSAEKEAEDRRPQSMLADMVCAQIGAINATDLFFKSQARPPMRLVERLAGGEALRSRLWYVAQDLFVRPRRLGGNVLLIDDIANTGASGRIYAAALKELAEAERVIAVNLAATRFAAGKDGRGRLNLDTSRLAGLSGLGEVWLDGGGVFHLDRECPRVERPANCEVRFVAEREGEACGKCVEPAAAPRRKWWRIW